MMMMMMEAVDGNNVSAVQRTGRQQAQYQVVVGTPALESSSSSISPSSDSSNNGEAAVVNDASWSCTNNDATIEEIISSKSYSSSILYSPMCFRILIVIIVFLLLDVVILSTYIYQQQPSSSSSSSSPVDSNSTSSTSTNINTGRYNDLGTLSWKALPPSDTVLTKVAFGSCMSQKMPQPHWDTLISSSSSTQPIDLLLLMGDNVYGNDDDNNNGDCTESTCQSLYQAYLDFEQHASVQGAASQLAVMATLDDHDYGLGDCYASNPYKDIAIHMFQKVFHIPDNELPSLSSQQSSSESSTNDVNDESAGGVYRSKIWGPPGQRIQVIMLDTRYGRGPFYSTIDSKSGETVYAPPLDDNNDNDFPQRLLSDRQWIWLQEQLQQPDVDLRLIVSSIQVLNDVTGYECWRHLPKERQRFYDILQQTQQTMIQNKNTRGPHNNKDDNATSSLPPLAPIMLLSGDRHVGGFYSTSNNHNDDSDDNANNDGMLPLYEVTAKFMDT